MAKRKKPGPKPGTMPKNYAQFRAAAKETQFAPGYSGQSTKQVKDTQHLREWLDQYDNPPPKRSTPAAGHCSVPCFPKELAKIRKKVAKQTKTHAERVREMLDKLKPEPSRMIDNDPVSLVKNYKG